MLLNTFPFVAMIVEYPCNQIPLDWRMLPFNLLLTVFYGIFNFFYCLITINDRKPLYQQLDWINRTGKAFINFFIILFIQIVVFTLQWLLTEKVKLPRYRAIVNQTKKSLDIKSMVILDDSNRANQTEALDRNNDSTRYLVKNAQSPLIV